MWFLMWGCSSLMTITIEESAVTTVEAGTILEELLDDVGFDDFVTMDITAAEELQNQGVEPGDIREARLTSFELIVLSPDEGDLSFMDSLRVAVEAPDIAQETLASHDSFEEGDDEISFALNDVDLTPFVVSRSLTIWTEVSAHRPDQDTELEARFRVEVTATVQGAVNQVQ